MTPQTIASFLAQTPIFRGCAAEMLARIAPALEARAHAAGEALVKPGSAATGLGILATGKASLRLVGPTGAIEASLEELGPGDCFGELGLLLGGVHPLAVVADEPCQALHMHKAHFEQIIGVMPSVGAALARRMSTRLVKLSMMKVRAAPAASPAPAAAAAAPSAEPRKLQKGEVRFVEVGDFQITPQTMDLIPSRLIQMHRVLPLELRGRTLVVGMVNPRSLEAQSDLRRVLHGADPEFVAIGLEDFHQALLRLKLDTDRSGAAAGAGARGPGGAPVRPSYFAEVKKEADKAQLVIGDEVVNLLDRILLEGVEKNASDVHIELESSGVRVRYRVQGLLVDRKEVVPTSFAMPLVARIKVLAEMDITERRLPQDGRIGAIFGKRELNFRVSTLAASRGEKVVVKIIDPASVMRPLEQIFSDAHVTEHVQLQLGAPYGAMIVAGPTGSGKTSTMYSMLALRRSQRPDNNIVSVEDPPEYLFSGITQVPVNARIGLDFPTVLRSLLRQDPDVVMIGELRDPSTASVALEAALTGHVVLTSMHGSTASSVLQRLVHLGADPTMMAQAVNMILVQRLAARLCPKCVREEEVSPALMEALATRHLIARAGELPRLPRAVGCDACDRTGYRGRVAVVELLVLTDELRFMLQNGAKPPDLLGRAVQSGHFVSAARSAALLMARKLISPADALLTVAG